MPSYYHFPSLSSRSFVTLGGFSWVRTDFWRRYVNTLIRARFPDAAAENRLNRHQDRRWHENNCIFTSLAEYLLYTFGFLVPDDRLFRFYNRLGEGVGVSTIIEAILSVVEPLGFELTRILAPDPELRQGLGYPELVVDIDQATEFHGRAGLCMINVRDGYSHAFFWKKMEQAKFAKEQFRLAVLVNPRAGFHLAVPSALGCFEEFHQLLLSSLPEGKNAALLQSELECLAGYLRQGANREKLEYRNQVQRRLETILVAYRAGVAGMGQKKPDRQALFLLETGKMVGRILRECSEIL
jgi:hypothetical protein